MALKQEHALLVGVATAGVVFGIYQLNMPTVAGARASKPGNIHLESARQGSTITAASLVVLLGLLSADPTVFVIGGVSVLALDASHRVANATDNGTGKIPAPGQTGAAATGSASISVTG